jgi:hypothetical protein
MPGNTVRRLQMSNSPQHSGPAEHRAHVPENQRGNWLTVPAKDPVAEYVADTLWDHPERPTSWEVARLSQAAYIYRETCVGWALVAKFYAVKAGSSAAKHASLELDRARQIQSRNVPKGEARAIEPLGLWRFVVSGVC